MNDISQGKKSRGRQKNGKPNPIDIHVGRRLRLKRELFGLSQEQLGKMLGLTFQQIQKYENGTNRISASRLWDLAMIFSSPVEYFYDDMDAETLNSSPCRLWGNAPHCSKVPADPLLKTETINLVSAFYKIREDIRHPLFEMIIRMSKTTYSVEKESMIADKFMP